MISALIPSRARPVFLAKSINSLRHNTRDELEVLVWVDDDDPYIDEYYNIEVDKMLIGPRGGGYFDLHKFVNALCEESTGDWLFLFNDDATMETMQWDNSFKDFNPADPHVINFYRPRRHNLFPVISRGLYNIIGHFSQDPHNDTYVELLSRQANIERCVGGVNINHFRAEMNDSTRRESKAACKISSPRFYTEEVQSLIALDAKKVLSVSQVTTI